MISQTDREREQYESRLKLQRDISTALAERLEEGLQQGREEGRAEERRGMIQYLQQRLRHVVLTADELQALSPPELASLVASLQAELDAKLDDGSLA